MNSRTNMNHTSTAERAFAEETNRLIVERLPYGALAFLAVMVAAWAFEHMAHPGRDSFYVIALAVDAAALCIAYWLVRQARWRAQSRMTAALATIVLIVCMGLYHGLVPGEAEILALGLVYLITGAMLLLPWGWEGQATISVAAVLTYVAAVELGARISTPLSIHLLGLGTIAALSVSGAAFLARYRLAFLHQAEELRATNMALAEANESKNQFLANVSHELRTPLNIIVGYTDLLLDAQFWVFPVAAREPLHRVARNSRNLVYLISDLLDLSRIEAGQLTVRLGTVELAPVFVEMARFVEPRIESKAVAFHLHPPGGVVVTADRDRLDQILVNLLSNAVKFTAYGEIHLAVRPPRDAMVEIEVRDTGIGITPEEGATIFEPFRQGQAGKALGGVGIGLSLSARLAAAMGGTLHFSSTPGQGASFVLRLPTAGAPVG